MTDRRQMHLNLFLHNFGHHSEAWKQPKASADNITNIRYFQILARIAEDAKFDSLFMASGVGFIQDIKTAGLMGLDPLLVMTAIASVTNRIGLISTISTTYNEPFHIARQFATLDHISNGRAGVNFVTSTSNNEAFNFGAVPLPEHSVRYEKAAEFIDVVKKLWASWEPDAVVLKQDEGVLIDPDKVHAIDHAGDWFNVRGPLTLPRPIQGHPVIVQAGSSDSGRELAAQHAEAIFTVQTSLEGAKAFYADVKGRAARYGRSPDQIKILPGLFTIVGSSEDEAYEKAAQLNEKYNIQSGLLKVKEIFQIDVTEQDLDSPFPPLPDISEITGHTSRFKIMSELVRKEKLTVRQLLHRFAEGGGHFSIVGTPKQIADQMEEWFTGGACDGFNFRPPVYPDGLSSFANLVIPELQKRGLFRTEYAEKTLSSRYGLKRS
ncbi:LLM class flavin-dependent oxidoreductase [Paenibacillaceae bacterium]|nr:LLM class flavin-dependent oxidoreductase [Paenibacillaceae bacterium]